MLRMILAAVCVMAFATGAHAKRLPKMTNSVGMTLVKIPAGSFIMGSPKSESGRFAGETQHSVTLTRSFYISAHEVTQSQYMKVMGTNPSRFKRCGGDCPVERVTMFEAMNYANLLSDQEGLSRCYSGRGENVKWKRSCTGYRLPTEAEWEYAARGGEDWVYSGASVAGDVAWYGANSGEKLQPVGKKQPNAWGLFDMSGNVFEMVWDRYGNYPTSAVTDPVGPSSGANRVIRGGSFFYEASRVRVAHRDFGATFGSSNDAGFRLVRTTK